MPGKVDEAKWNKAKEAASKSYKESDKAYWPTVETIYENMGGKHMKANLNNPEEFQKRMASEFRGIEIDDKMSELAILLEHKETLSEDQIKKYEDELRKLKIEKEKLIKEKKLAQGFSSASTKTEESASDNAAYDDHQTDPRKLGVGNIGATRLMAAVEKRIKK